MPTIEPTPERIQQFASAADEGPVVMINLLRYREHAAYPPGSDAASCSGEEAYARYAAAVFPLLEKHGARLLWRASARMVVIGPADESWDEALLVEYPSRGHLVAMVTSPEYQAIAPHRTAALADSRLIATTTTAISL